MAVVSQLSYHKYRSNILVTAERSSPFNWGQLGAVTVPVVNDLVLLEMTMGTVLSTKHLFYLLHTEWLHSDKFFRRNVFRQRTTISLYSGVAFGCVYLEKCLLLIL